AVDAGTEFGLASGAVGASLLYPPPKVLTALLGLPAGALAGVVTGGDLRTMYAVWVPTVTGTYFLTPAHLEGARPIEFFGSHYPTTLGCEANPSMACTHDARCSKAPKPAP